jgi:hypothetical protein
VITDTEWGDLLRAAAEARKFGTVEAPDYLKRIADALQRAADIAPHRDEVAARATVPFPATTESEKRWLRRRTKHDTVLDPINGRRIVLQFDSAAQTVSITVTAAPPAGAATGDTFDRVLERFRSYCSDARRQGFFNERYAHGCAVIGEKPTPRLWAAVPPVRLIARSGGLVREAPTMIAKTLATMQARYDPHRCAMPVSFYEHPGRVTRGWSFRHALRAAQCAIVSDRAHPIAATVLPCMLGATSPMRAPDGGWRALMSDEQGDLWATAYALRLLHDVDAADDAEPSEDRTSAITSALHFIERQWRTDQWAYHENPSSEANAPMLAAEITGVLAARNAALRDEVMTLFKTWVTADGRFTSGYLAALKKSNEKPEAGTYTSVNHAAIRVAYATFAGSSELVEWRGLVRTVLASSEASWWDTSADAAYLVEMTEALRIGSR